MDNNLMRIKRATQSSDAIVDLVKLTIETTMKNKTVDFDCSMKSNQWDELISGLPSSQRQLGIRLTDNSSIARDLLAPKTILNVNGVLVGNGHKPIKIEGDVRLVDTGILIKSFGYFNLFIYVDTVNVSF